jgi:hypothetical protein
VNRHQIAAQPDEEMARKSAEDHDNVDPAQAYTIVSFDDFERDFRHSPGYLIRRKYGIKLCRRLGTVTLSERHTSQKKKVLYEKDVVD